jgi:ABC-type nitrate/sulfonate/bicarbonate transport system substrate-binding protein
MKRVSLLTLPALIAGFLLAGCGETVDTPSSGPAAGPGATSTVSSAKPVFSLAWSEYPSWSVFGVAHEKGLINGEQGKLGKMEEKWGVDIVLKEADYDPCITMYNSGSCDAVCITNMDILNPALGRGSVAIMPTSTSVGADACVVVGIRDVKELRKHKVYGLEKSVSEYAFFRNIDLLGEKESDHHFTNMDPGPAAVAMQNKQPGFNAIMVWNPYVLQTLKTNPSARRLFDSRTIPEEIIDMVVVAKGSLEKPGGKDFAHAVIDTYYEFNRLLADPKTGDDTLVALGKKFSKLGLAEMKQVVEETRFYKTPEAALKLFTGPEFPKTMERVVDFCLKHKIILKKPMYRIGAAGAGSDAQLLFDPSYIQEVQARK